MRDFFKGLWDALDGNKTKIAAFFWVIQSRIVPIIFDGNTPETLEKVLAIIAESLILFGLGDAGRKMITRKK